MARRSGFLGFLTFALLGFGGRERFSSFFGFCTPWVLVLGSVFLAFLPFPLPGFWLDGVYFLLFLFFHSLALDAGECIS